MSNGGAAAGKPRSAGVREYLPDFLVFVAVLLFQYSRFFRGFYASFFLDESSDGIMQIVYYLKALNTGASPFWDTYVQLSTAAIPVAPLFSPVTLAILAISRAFSLNEPTQIASLFAAVSYAVQVLTGFSMYLLLRYLSLGRLAALIGGIGYSYNYFTGFFGIFQGYYRMTALMFVPLALIFAFRLFREKGSVWFHASMTGLLTGLAVMGNGDVKPSLYFVFVVFAVACCEGFRTHGRARALGLFLAAMVLAGAVLAPQMYPTYETVQESFRADLPYVSDIPYHQADTVLGFSQNSFSAVMGFLLPESYFQFFNFNTSLGITAYQPWEMRFSYGVPLLLLALIGVFYRTRLHRIWFTTFVVFGLYLLSGSTPLWNLFGMISQKLFLRYPTRAAIIIYFILSIYAAYGVEVITRRAGDDFYAKYSGLVLRWLAAFSGILLGGAALTFLLERYDLFHVPNDVDPLALAFTYLARALSIAFLCLLVPTLATALFWRDSANRSLRFLVPALLALFAGLLLVFILAGYFVYADLLVTQNPFYRDFFAASSRKILRELPYYDLGRFRFHSEVFMALASAGLVMATVAAGRKFRGRSTVYLATLPMFIVMVVLFLKNGDPGRRLPPHVVEHPDAALMRDEQLAPLYRDPTLADYRIYLPTDYARTFTREPGFRKIVNNYCCRQYLDDLRLAFGLVDGPGTPGAYGIVNYYVSSTTADHPYWKLYNVRYLVFDFVGRPDLLPADPDSYERLSDLVIRLKDTNEMAYFLEDFTVVDKETFLHEVLPSGDAAMLTRVYLHDAPETSHSGSGAGGPPAGVRFLEKVSGRMRAEVSVPRPGFLVFSEVWAPSWRVYVDGREEKTLRAYGMLQAVQVGPGRHEVLFEYDIFGSWKMKAAVAACALALLTIGAALWNRVRAPHRTELESPPPA